MLLFFFLLLMLAIAWGVADHLQSLAHRAPPPAATAITIEAATPQAPAVTPPGTPPVADGDAAGDAGGDRAGSRD
ncbi:MAG TPA: hypothetical protein PL117_18865 [Accumulibacter sp.]|mgnify:CR=1 FL=1|uniref:hypothetical protein n=1 Tax=Accumulibacter sp. TaxID=2053492 RepID=UPI002638F957|nr:hypothetical protein [Accumulibacter sp.]HRD92321.1 hypothetical protein [Accumulibacter sp.]HRF74828.1 hypothetical protein [Accumulibacter sp.]